MKRGFLFIDKPSGPSSHDIVNQVRRILGIRRVGHCGTLDPFATGLIILCVGRATKISEYILKKDKTYEFEIRLGSVSDTFDCTGNVRDYKGNASIDDLKEEAVHKAVKGFEGRILQTPPLYSAIKKKGKKLYEYARSGEYVQVEPREIFIHKLRIIKFFPPFICLKARVSSGTYIRSLGNDIGLKLGTGAYVNSLRRTSIGNFEVDKAVSVDNASNWKVLRRGWKSIREVLFDWRWVEVTDEESKRIRNGQAVRFRKEYTPRIEEKHNRILVLNTRGEEICTAILKSSKSIRGEWLIQPDKLIQIHE